jgi:hypothetical protein
VICCSIVALVLTNLLSVIGNRGRSSGAVCAGPARRQAWRGLAIVIGLDVMLMTGATALVYAAPALPATLGHICAFASR